MLTSPGSICMSQWILSALFDLVSNLLLSYEIIIGSTLLMGYRSDIVGFWYCQYFYVVLLTSQNLMHVSVIIDIW
jgi:hypothetical protein